MELQTLIASVGASVQQAQALLEQAAVHQYLDYYHAPNEASCDGAMRPKTVPLLLPGRQEGERVEVPLLALCGHNTMRLEQIKVKLNVSPAMEAGRALEVAPAPAADGADSIELLFQCGGPSEGIARINDNANQII